ncbi:hypothetical protein KP509_14G054200 [Ceratopteris richardii]|uniref:Uncharacterized protein n=1 Tax=Ceratopteris richardii TaxID=49495 RepID=A0A8T2TAA1_CERRI|nr:hypothetical protein KP509_14G054200 [Ceratopteris richardii]
MQDMKRRNIVPFKVVVKDRLRCRMRATTWPSATVHHQGGRNFRAGKKRNESDKYNKGKKRNESESDRTPERSQMQCVLTDATHQPEIKSVNLKPATERKMNKC